MDAVFKATTIFLPKGRTTFADVFIAYCIVVEDGLFIWGMRVIRYARVLTGVRVIDMLECVSAYDLKHGIWKEIHMT